MPVSHGICKECYIAQTGHPPRREPTYSGPHKVICAWCEKILYDPEDQTSKRRWRRNIDDKWFTGELEHLPQNYPPHLHARGANQRYRHNICEYCGEYLT